MLFRKFFSSVAAVAVLASMMRQRPTVYEDFPVRPGPWFKEYLNDWMEAFDIDDTQRVTSGIATGEISGDYIWVTETPEWDRAWFNERGYRFPRKWVPYRFLLDSIGMPGGPCLLRGL